MKGDTQDMIMDSQITTNRDKFGAFQDKNIIITQPKENFKKLNTMNPKKRQKP